MRPLLIVLFVLLGSFILPESAAAQEWKDTLNIARKLYTQGKYREALKYYKTAEEIAPKEVNLSEEIGQTAYKAGDYKTAEENYSYSAQEAKTTKDKIRLNNNLAETRMKQKNYDGAIEAYKTVLRIDSKNEKARQGLMEAKRQKAKSCQNPNNQNQKENQNQNQNQNQNSNCNNNSNNQNNQNNQNHQNKDNKSNNGQQQSQGNKPQQQNQSGQKLQNKQADRKLDELSRQEMNTKRRLGGTKGTSSGKSARKDW